ncbi:capsid cement protein [Corynebacterium gallinarum]|uniref:DUF2190 family protein n=1 Tax=Corynebacterium gallinarum TaxID=2762214 RepID=A0A8I0HS09_9CORY|nr:capsid cement protein [Corynebacterium gallinarum]MBD8031410.1 DUF2190 family protein [Corynebacterium gallinarum]
MYQNIMQDRFTPGTDLTAVADTAVVGKTFVAIAGPLKGGNIVVETATAGSATAGVAKYDAKAGALVGVARGSSRVVTVTAGATITAGTAVEVGPAGKAIPATTGITVGYAVDDAADATDALISLAN